MFDSPTTSHNNCPTALIRCTTPDSRYLAIHATCRRVVHTSGATGFVESYMGNMGHLANVGSTPTVFSSLDLKMDTTDTCLIDKPKKEIYADSLNALISGKGPLIRVLISLA